MIYNVKNIFSDVCFVCWAYYILGSYIYILHKTSTIAIIIIRSGNKKGKQNLPKSCTLNCTSKIINYLQWKCFSAGTNNKLQLNDILALSVLMADLWKNGGQGMIWKRSKILWFLATLIVIIMTTYFNFVVVYSH